MSSDYFPQTDKRVPKWELRATRTQFGDGNMGTDGTFSHRGTYIKREDNVPSGSCEEIDLRRNPTFAVRDSACASEQN